MKSSNLSLVFASLTAIAMQTSWAAPPSHASLAVTLNVAALALVGSDPANNADEVPRTVQPVLTFSTALNRASVSPSRIALRSTAGVQNASFSVVGEQLKLLPTTTLLPFAQYTLDVVGLRGIDGEVLAAPLAIHFTTRDGAWQTAALLEHTAAYATSPKLAVGANGSAVAVWLQHNGTNFSAWANRYLPNIGWGQAIALEGDHASDSFDPAVAVDRNGNAFALWDRYDGTHWNIYADRYVPGAGWSGAQVITNSIASSGTIPQVAFDSSGNAIAIWTQYADDGAQNVIVNRYVAGSGWSGPIVIDGGNTTNLFGPEIGFDAQGNAIALWQGNQNGVTLVWSNRYVAGTGWGNAQPVQSDLGSNGFSAQLDVAANGNAFAVWEQNESVYASRYVVNSGWQAQTALSTTTNGYGPQIAVNSNGEALAVWAQVVVSNATEIPVTRGIIWGNRYTNGAWEPATLLQSPGGFTSDSPQVVIDASGNGLAAWNQFNGSVYRIYTTRYHANEGWSARQLIDAPTTQGSFSPQLDIDGTGNIFAVWQQSENTGTQSIWVNRFQ